LSINYVFFNLKYINSICQNLNLNKPFASLKNARGEEILEVLSVLLEQDEDAKATFDKLTDGKKRSLVYTIQRVKDIDRKVEMILEFLHKEREKIQRKK